MVQEIRRMFGRAELRVLSLLALIVLAGTMAFSRAQMSESSDPYADMTVQSWDDVLKRYLDFREQSYQLIVPSYGENIEALLEELGFDGLQQQPNWYWNFDLTLYFDDKSELASYVEHNSEVVIFEDIVQEEIRLLDGESYKEQIVYKAPAWPDYSEEESYDDYISREISKRRVALRVTLKNKAQAAEEQEESEEGEGGGIVMNMTSGGDCTNLVFTCIEASTNNTIDVGLCVPDGITNVDLFVSTNLMPEGFPWVMVATNLPVTTNSVVWSWTNVMETNVFFSAGDGTTDTDGDGLKDSREFYLFGTDMSTWDTDGDSYSDGEELTWGTDSLDMNSQPPLGRGVVINEVLYNPVGDDANKEWVEFFNTNRAAVDLSGFIIQTASNAFANVFTFPTGTVIESGDFLLVGGSSITNADHVVAFNMINRFSFGPTAGIRLIAPSSGTNAVVDCLLYAPTNNWGLPTTGFGTDGFAPYTFEGEDLQRIKTGYDTDHASDWMHSDNINATGQGDLPDIDGDGISNSVEIAGYTSAYGFVNTSYNEPDSDGDGLNDGEESTNQPPTNPNNPDTDGDAFPWSTNGSYYGSDGDEVHNGGTDPTNSDMDADGLPDGWELALGLSPTNTDSNTNGVPDGAEDTDGDSVSNADEMNQNSNPDDAADNTAHAYVLKLISAPPGWQNGEDMGTRTEVIYHLQNVLATTTVAFVIADGGHTAETFNVFVNNMTGAGQTGGRTNIVWGIIAPGSTPVLVIQDGGTTWPNENPSERGADLSVDEVFFDIATDINNDGTVGPADDPLEDKGIGEIVRVDDTDDSPGGEDDLQYMKLNVESPITTGVVWFTYDTNKVAIWADSGKTQSVASASEAQPNWTLASAIPSAVYVQGLTTTAPNNSISVVLHLKIQGAELADTNRITVTDQVGHYAYFAGVADYLAENNYHVFRDVVDAQGGTTQDFRLVAVRRDTAYMTVHDAYTPNPQHESIYDVIDANTGAYIIVNGTFWDALDFGVADHTDGRVLNVFTNLPISEDMQSDEAPEVKGWLGQRNNSSFNSFAPNLEPPVPTPPYGDTAIRAAAGGLAALHPADYGLTLSEIISEITDEHGDWNDRQSNHIGWSSTNNVLFVMTTYAAEFDNYTPDIVLSQVMTALIDSGADIIRGLDGGQSVALAHRDRQGNSLAVATSGDRHNGSFFNYVNNYIVIALNP